MEQLNGVTVALVLRELFKKTELSALDFIIIAAVALISLSLLIFSARGGTPTACVIEINGVERARYDLAAVSGQKVIEIDNEYGKNTVVIDGQGAEVTFSDCADSLEVKAGKIVKGGQSLICLPHRLVIRLEGKSASDGLSW